MMEVKIKEQQRARALRSRGMSLNQITRCLGVAKSSVSTWVRDVDLTLDQQQMLKMREIEGAKRGRRLLQEYWQEYRKLHPKPLPKGPRWPARESEKFFDAWSPEMAYVLGFFAADGSMYENKHGSCYVAFCSTEKELITSIKSLMKVDNEIEEYQPRGKRKRRYTLQVGSKKMFNRLINLGFTPNKSLKLKFPKIPKNHLGHFVRGYFDGDGNVYLGNVKRNNGCSRGIVLTARFICGTKSFLSCLQRYLIKLGIIKGGSLNNHDRAYCLKYGAEDARQLYRFMYPTDTVPCLKRKRDIFERAFKELDP